MPLRGVNSNLLYDGEIDKLSIKTAISSIGSVEKVVPTKLNGGNRIKTGPK